MTRSSLVLTALTALLIGAAPAGDLADPALSGAGLAGAEVEVATLEAPEPDWYTDALHREVVRAAAAGEGVALPDGVEIETSGLAFTGIRPGSWMVSPAGCTLNFVFGSVPGGDTSTATASRDDGAISLTLSHRDDHEPRGGQSEDRRGGPGSNNGNRGARGAGGSGTYIGTAGHCTEVGDEVTIVAAPGILMNIGTTVRSVDNGVGDDFALIEIRPEMVQHVNPSTAYFGGPTSAGDPQPGDLVGHAGHGLVVGTGGTPRAGVAVYRGDGSEPGSDAVAWSGVASLGDSGSFLVDLDGTTAAGNVTHLVVGGPYVPGNVAGTSIDRMLEIARQPLATAPAGPDPFS